MRALADAVRIGNLMHALAQEADRESHRRSDGGTDGLARGDDLYRYPAIDPAAFRRAARQILRDSTGPAQKS